MGKEACVLQRREGCREGLQNSCLRVGSPVIMTTWGKFALQLTARQYGEVVLPDAIPAEPLTWFFGRGFLSAGKGVYGVVFAFMVQILLSAGAIAVQV